MKRALGKRAIGVGIALFCSVFVTGVALADSGFTNQGTLIPGGANTNQSLPTPINGDNSVNSGNSVFNTSGGGSVTLTNPLGTTSLSTAVNNIINFLATSVAIPVCTIMVIWGAFQMMTAGGEPEKFSNGRKTILYAAVGFAIALVATGVTTLIQSIIQGQ